MSWAVSRYFSYLPQETKKQDCASWVEELFHTCAAPKDSFVPPEEPKAVVPLRLGNRRRCHLDLLAPLFSGQWSDLIQCRKKGS